MKTLKWSLLVVLVTGVGVSTVMLRTRSPRTQTTEANARSQAAEGNEPVVHQSAPSAPVPVRKLAPAIPLTPDKTDVPAAGITSQPANVMWVRADRVLAKVNDQTILLKDLVPLRPEEQEQAMTPEEYESRLNRAIEMELTFKAAVAQGVDLMPEQKKRVDGVARRHEAILQEYRKQGVTWSSVTPAQLEFEKRLTSALMLQENLVATEAGVAPASDPSVQLRYEQARNEVLSRLKANGNVSISTAGFY
jgi:hypothetical protein